MSLKYISIVLSVMSYVSSQSEERSVVPITVVISPNNAVQSLVKNLESIGDILPVGITSFAIPSYPNRNWGQSRPPYQNGNSIDQFQRPYVPGHQHPTRPGNAQPNIVIIDRHRPHHHGRPRPHYPMQPGNQNQQFYPGWPMYNNQPQYPNQPMFNGNQPTYNGNQPLYNGNQPIYNGNQPTYNGNQPIYNGNQPTYNGNQPIYNGNLPIYNGNQPIYNGNQPQYSGQPFDNGNQQYQPIQPENPNPTPPTDPNQPITQPPFVPSVKPTLPVVPITQPTPPPTVLITQPPLPVTPITSPPVPSKPETDETGNIKKGDQQPEFDFDVRFGGGDSE